MKVKELIKWLEKCNQDLEVRFAVYSCGQTSEYPLEENDIREYKDRVVVLSDLN